MLRDRFRKWQINNKNRRAKAQSKDLMVQTPSYHIAKVDSPSRPPPVCIDDVQLRHILCNCSHWYDETWRQKNLSSFVDTNGPTVFVHLRRASDAIFLATQTNSQTSWEILKQIGGEIYSIPWLQLSPDVLVDLLDILLEWQMGPWDENESALLTNLRSLWQAAVVERLALDHPISLLTRAALQGNLSVILCERMSNLAESKIVDNVEDTAQKERLVTRSRIISSRMFYDIGEYWMIDHLLAGYDTEEGGGTRLSPEEISKICYLLATSKFQQRKYAEAERLFDEASRSNPVDRIARTFDIAKWHIRVLLCQNKITEVVMVLDEALSRHSPDIEECDAMSLAAMSLRNLAYWTKVWRVEVEDCDELDCIVQRLSSLKLD